MLIEQTMERLRALRLTGMAEALIEQQQTITSNELSFDERLGLLVDSEYTYRENSRLYRYLREAKLRHSQACLEDLDYAPRRKIEKAVIAQLAVCLWIKEHQNIIITGATGVGKSYLSCALGNQACRKGFRVLYRRVPRLFEELALSHADGTYPKLLKRFAKSDVLILDDFGMTPMKSIDRRDLLELLEDRDDMKSTIIAGQLPPESWHDYINDPTTADAICDRVIHNAHKINLKGPSKRKELAQKNKRK
ncbi:MAG: ATP-binding protein [Deltaproteobacteria bacterium]|nr:ATP-binding protein [Deltaproteobacteria bacterium]